MLKTLNEVPTVAAFFGKVAPLDSATVSDLFNPFPDAEIRRCPEWKHFVSIGIDTLVIQVKKEVSDALNDLPYRGRNPGQYC